MGRIIRAGLVGGIAALALSACTPPPTTPGGEVSQQPPVGVNGLFEEDGSVWVADLFGGQLLRFDPESGDIDERYGPGDGLCGTDDVVVTDDDTLVATCPTTGQVIAVSRGGTARTLAAVGEGVNPIALDPLHDAVLVGFGNEEDDRILRVFLDGRPTEVVATDLPVLNGFDVGPDGTIYAPTGGAGGLLGTGGLGRIDPATGEFRQIDLDFSGARTGFDFACGVDVAPDGTVFVVQCLNPAVYEVDPVPGAATRVGGVSTDFADNIVLLDDGRIIVSGFIGNRVTVLSPDGGGGYSRRVRTIGR